MILPELQVTYGVSVASEGGRLIGWFPTCKCPHGLGIHLAAVKFSGPPGVVWFSAGLPPETPVQLHMCEPCRGQP